MKVLQVVGSLGRGGAETMITNYNKVAKENGCKFDYIIHENQKFGYEEDVKKLEANLFLIDKPGKIGLINYIKLLVKTIRENGPYDAIHAHTDYQVFMTVIAAKIANVPNCVVHSHTTNYSLIQKIVNRIIFFILKPVKLACGEEAGIALYGKNNFFVLNNAIFVDEYITINKEKIEQLKKEIGILDNNIVLGQVGRLINLKNHIFSLKVLNKLLEKNKNYLLLIVGDGEEKENLINICKDMGIQKNVKFLGLRNDMKDIYHLFDALLMPSLYEGLPMTLLEAQSVGIPCICSNNISKESDRKLGLVNFIPLEQIKWIQVLESIKNNELSSIKIKKAMAEYDIINQCNDLLNYYQLGNKK